MGFDWQTCAVMTCIDHQSPDISMGVAPGHGLYKEQGAGDQGMMFGYATDNSRVHAHAHHAPPQDVPTPAETRKNGTLDFLGPTASARSRSSMSTASPCAWMPWWSPPSTTPTWSMRRAGSIINHVIKKVIPDDLMDERPATTSTPRAVSSSADRWATAG